MHREIFKILFVLELLQDIILTKRAIKKAVSDTNIEGQNNKVTIGGKRGKCPHNHNMFAKEAEEWELSYRSRWDCVICRDGLGKMFSCDRCMYDICVQCRSNDDIEASVEWFQNTVCALVEQCAEHVAKASCYATNIPNRDELTKDLLLCGCRAAVVSLWGPKNTLEESVIHSSPMRPQMTLLFCTSLYRRTLHCETPASQISTLSSHILIIRLSTEGRRIDPL